MAHKVLFPQKTATTAYFSAYGVYGFASSATLSIYNYWCSNTDSVFVECDGVVYECTPQTLEALGAIAVGNCTAFGGTGNTEPFIVTLMLSDGYANWMFAALTDTEATEHTIKVYQEVESDVVLDPQTIIFTENSNGEFKSEIDPAAFLLSVGDFYRVNWDGVEYICRCYQKSILSASLMGSPFEIKYYINGGDIKNEFYAKDTFATHEVAIYWGLGDSTPELLFPETTLDNFVHVNEVDSVAMYQKNVENVDFTLTAGTQYIVVWNNIPYTCTAIGLDDGYVCLGYLPEDNGNSIDTTKEPFSIGVSENMGVTNYLFYTSAAVVETSHTVTIYQIKEGTSEEASVDIVLKDINGVEQTYTEVTALRIPRSDGTMQNFIAGTLAQKIVDADFSEGDMTIVADADTVMSEVTVNKPATLVPENIAKDVEIAGVVGTLLLKKEINVVSGTITGPCTSATITHNLGTIPDIVMVSQPSTAGYSDIKCILSFSKSFSNKVGIGGFCVLCVSNSSSTLNPSGYHNIASYCLDGIYGPLRNANDLTVEFQSSYSINGTATWRAISGLT